MGLARFWSFFSQTHLFAMLAIRETRLGEHFAYCANVGKPWEVFITKV
jgi:hypothetical protein